MEGFLFLNSNMNYLYAILLFLTSFICGSLISPNNGDLLNYTHIMFEWEQQPDAVGYNLQVSSNDSFSNIILDIDETDTVYIDINNFIWNRSYYWRVRPIRDCDDCQYGDWIGTSFFNIGQINSPYIEEGDEVEILTEIYQDDFIEEGYVAVGAFNPRFHSFIIDKFGNEIWNDGVSFDNGIESSSFFMINHINNYGNIFGYSHLNQNGLKVDSDMNHVWSTISSEPLDIHEFKQIPNGNFMGFQNEYILGPIPSDISMTQDFQSIGYQADGTTLEFPWYGQKIVEWNNTGQVVWTWNPFEHFPISDYDRLGFTWFQAHMNGEYDWLHANAFHFDDVENVIYISFRHLSRITKISYPSGDVIWNMGLSEEYINSGNEQICTELGFSYQHNIQVLDDGDLLFFDNGNLSQIVLGDENPTSRIRRIKVIDNSFCEIIWEYELPEGLFGSAAGSVQLLENGNYLINTLGTGSIIEVTPEKEIIWKHTSNYNAWYRAYKIPSIHPSAFSVLAENYISDEDQDVIKIAMNTVNFRIENKSAYSIPYRYIFSDLSTESNQLFDDENGIINIEPFGNSELSFQVNDQSNLLDSQIMLTIWPYNHQYAMKELEFSIKIDRLLGDLNYDNLIDILDIVIIVNSIINEMNILNADINDDSSIDILDVIQIMNIVLNS